LYIGAAITGVMRVEHRRWARQTLPLTDLAKMDWLVEGVIGQPR
jgi:hypothetical protein